METYLRCHGASLHCLPLAVDDVAIGLSLVARLITGWPAEFRVAGEFVPRPMTPAMLKR